MSSPIRVLFMVEDITLAQVVRLVTLAKTLDPDRYEVHFASAHFDDHIFRDTNFVRHTIFTVDAKEAFRRLEKGKRLYEEQVLARYVDEELALFRGVRPRVVVGDLRFSLSVSTAHARIAYAALINAYWSRAMEREEFPLPDHPIVNLLGEKLAGKYFPKALPRVLEHFAAPVNRLRKRYGLSPVGDLIDVLMYGDRTMFPDVPLLTPLREQALHEVFLGPVLWEPKTALPDWWMRPLPSGPSAYVTFGSSGRLDRMPIAIAGLRKLNIPLMVATAGRVDPARLEPPILAAKFLPGGDAAKRASFVVCNGGSSTAYQALAQGRPVLGIASNLDQYLAMTAVRDAGAGILLRADSLTPEKVEAAGRTLIEDTKYQLAARRVARALRSYDCGERFGGVLRELGA